MFPPCALAFALSVCFLVNMSALQQYGGADLVVTPTFHKASHQSWPLFAMVWVSSIFLAFLCGILFWHLWGPRFHQMREVLSGISWTLKSGIRGALVSTWRMLMWGALNLVETKLAYETEPVQNPHMVEIDRMPPPPTEEIEVLHGMGRLERMDATPPRDTRGVGRPMWRHLGSCQAQMATEPGKFIQETGEVQWPTNKAASSAEWWRHQDPQD